MVKKLTALVLALIILAVPVVGLADRASTYIAYLVVPTVPQDAGTTITIPCGIMDKFGMTYIGFDYEYTVSSIPDYNVKVSSSEKHLTVQIPNDYPNGEKIKITFAPTLVNVVAATKTIIVANSSQGSTEHLQRPKFEISGSLSTDADGTSYIDKQGEEMLVFVEHRLEARRGKKVSLNYGAMDRDGNMHPEAKNGIVTVYNPDTGKYMKASTKKGKITFTVPKKHPIGSTIWVQYAVGDQVAAYEIAITK